MMLGDMFGNTMWVGHWPWMLVIAIIVVIPAWRICQRTGYPGQNTDFCNCSDVIVFGERHCQRSAFESD